MKAIIEKIINKITKKDMIQVQLNEIESLKKDLVKEKQHLDYSKKMITAKWQKYLDEYQGSQERIEIQCVSCGGSANTHSGKVTYIIFEEGSFFKETQLFSANKLAKTIKKEIPLEEGISYL